MSIGSCHSLNVAFSRSDATTSRRISPPCREGGTTPQSGMPSPTQNRTDTLFRTLDANQDGAVTEQEFTEGALKLLRDAGARRHARYARRNSAETHTPDRPETPNAPEATQRSDSSQSRREAKLAEKLHRVFERVDANHDGSIGQDELAAALAKVDSHRRRGEHARHEPKVRQEPEVHPAPVATPVPTPEPHPESAPRPASARDATRSTLGISVTKVTVIAIAIERYTAVAQTSGPPSQQA